MDEWMDENVVTDINYKESFLFSSITKQLQVYLDRVNEAFLK